MKNNLIKNRIDVTLWALTVLSALTAIASYFFLPNDIPMQWSGLDVNWYANKLAIFLSPIFCLVIIFLIKPEINSRFRSPLISNIVMVSLIVIFLTCEIYTIAYCFGLRWRLDFVLLAELISILIIGIIIVVRYRNNSRFEDH
ncbi:MAG: DUF1648 domain-containing protein [Caldicoprobacterales bacterium]